METIARLQGLMAFNEAINSVGDLTDYWKGYILTQKQAKTAQEATAVATSTSTKAFKGLGLALKGLGIGLIVSAIAFLVSNWDNLSESVGKLIPGLKDTGKIFGEITNVVKGVGGAILNFLIAPIKSFISLIQGDFDGALEAMKQGVDVVGNYEKSYQESRVEQAKEAERKLAEQRVKGYEYLLKQLKQGSKDYQTVENELAEARIKAAESEEDRLAAIQEKNLIYSQRQIKAAEDARKKQEEITKKGIEQRKAALEELKALNEESEQLIKQSGQSERQKELSALQNDYDRRISIYKKFGQDSSKLTEAFNIQRLAINEKYDKQINDALIESENRNLTAYENKKVEINKKIDELLKNATEKQKQLLETLRTDQLSAVGRESNLSSIAIKANVNLVTTTTDNSPSDLDTPEQRAAKVFAINKAQYDAEQASYELKLEQLKGNQEAIEELTANHYARLTQLNQDRVNNEKALDDAQYGYKVDTLNKVGDAVGALGQLIGEQTAVGKGLAIAQATINTFTGATEVLKAPTTIPEPYGTIAKFASAAALIANGLATVKKIASVQVNGSASGSSVSALSITAPSMANATVPNIPASSLTQTTVQDVRVTNQQDMIVRAYLTDKDLKDSEQRANFFNNISTL